MASRRRIFVPSPAHRPVGRARPSIRLSLNRRAAIQHYKSLDDPANYGRLVSHLCNNAESQKLHEILPLQHWHEFRRRHVRSKYARIDSAANVWWFHAQFSFACWNGIK